jgi:hypothetical protein
MILLYAFIFAFAGCCVGIFTGIVLARLVYDYAKLRRRQYRRNKRLRQELGQ